MSGNEHENGYRAHAEFYDGHPVYEARQDVEFYVEMAARHSGPALEIGCGTGRILIPTARAGVKITGLDDSEQMLKVCREKLQREPEDVRGRVTLASGDMRDFDLGRQFATIAIPFRPFQHLIEVNDQLAALRCIREHLTAGGILVFDVFDPSLPMLVDDALLSESGTDAPYETSDGRQVIRKEKILSRDYPRQTMRIEFIYYVTHPDGREERLTERFDFRYFFRYEIEHLLTRAGFKIETIYSDFDKSPHGTKYPKEIIVLARKK